MDTIVRILPEEVEKTVFLVLVIFAAYVVQRILQRVIRKVLDSDKLGMPSASIFINLMRIMVYGFAVAIVLKPVFGIDPTAVVTALGIGGLAISLGLKDTIANIIAGLQITVSGTIKPGDFISVNGMTGVVNDITWRQTNLKTRVNETIAIPNSVLNTASLKLLPYDVEGFGAIPFTVKPDINPEAIEKEIVEASYKAAGHRLYPRETDETTVKFLSFDPYGIKGEIWITVLPQYAFGSTKDLIVRELLNKPYFVSFDDNKDSDKIVAPGPQA